MKFLYYKKKTPLLSKKRLFKDLHLNEYEYNEIKSRILGSLEYITRRHNYDYWEEVDVDENGNNLFVTNKVPKRKWFSVQEIFNNCYPPYLYGLFNQVLSLYEKKGKIVYNKNYDMWRLKE